jgi:hypothetical protein
LSWRLIQKGVNVTAAGALKAGKLALFDVVTALDLGATEGSLIKVSVGQARQLACADCAGPAKITNCELKGVTD